MLINLGNYLINMDNVSSIASVDGKKNQYFIEIETNVGSTFKATYISSTERDNDYYLIIRKYKEKASCISLSGTASVEKPTTTNITTEVQTNNDITETALDPNAGSETSPALFDGDGVGKTGGN